MHTRPLSITVISWIFIAIGCLSLLIGLLHPVHGVPAQPTDARTAHQLADQWLVPAIHILAIVGGVFLLYGCNWARWLLVGWMGFHVILSAWHSPLALLVHGSVFAVVFYFLFRPPASAYFRATNAEPP